MITVCHHSTNLVTPNGDPSGQIFLSHPYTNDGYLLSHIPHSNSKEDTNRKATRRCRYTRDDMLKWRHLIMSHLNGFRSLYELFNKYIIKMRILMVSKKKIVICVRTGQKPPPLVITVCHHSASLLMPNSPSENCGSVRESRHG